LIPGPRPAPHLCQAAFVDRHHDHVRPGIACAKPADPVIQRAIHAPQAPLPRQERRQAQSDGDGKYPGEPTAQKTVHALLRPDFLAVARTQGTGAGADEVVDAETLRAGELPDETVTV